MEIKIIGERLPITEAISQYIQEKFSHLSKPDKLNLVEFRLGTKKDSQYVHFSAYCAKGDIIIKTEDTNLYTAVDKIMKKIHRSFTKAKEKNNIHLSR